MSTNNFCMYTFSDVPTYVNSVDNLQKSVRRTDFSLPPAYSTLMFTSGLVNWNIIPDSIMDGDSQMVRAWSAYGVFLLDLSAS